MQEPRGFWGFAPAAARLPQNIYGKMKEGGAHV